MGSAASKQKSSPFTMKFRRIVYKYMMFNLTTRVTNGYRLYKLLSGMWRRIPSNELTDQILIAKRSLRCDVNELRKYRLCRYNDAECCICLDRSQCKLFFPCMHSSVCSACTPKVLKCPMCRQDIMFVISD